MYKVKKSKPKNKKKTQNCRIIEKEKRQKDDKYEKHRKYERRTRKRTIEVNTWKKRRRIMNRKDPIEKES